MLEGRGGSEGTILRERETDEIGLLSGRGVETGLSQGGRTDGRDRTSLRKGGTRRDFSQIKRMKYDFTQGGGQDETFSGRGGRTRWGFSQGGGTRRDFSQGEGTRRDFSQGKRDKTGLFSWRGGDGQDGASLREGE